MHNLNGTLFFSATLFRNTLLLALVLRLILPFTTIYSHTNTTLAQEFYTLNSC